MAEVLLFHNALGLTQGCLALAEAFRAGGHEVHTPDLYDGRTFADLADGLAYAEQIGFPNLMERGREIAERLPPEIFYVGFSLGVVPAQMLAQTLPGAQGAVLISSCIPAGEFGPWPEGVPLQVHMKESDQIVVTEGDLEAARELVQTNHEAELFLYPGDRHYFADSSHLDYDESATTLLKQRVVSFLQGVG